MSKNIMHAKLLNAKQKSAVEQTMNGDNILSKRISEALRYVKCRRTSV